MILKEGLNMKKILALMLSMKTTICTLTAISTRKMQRRQARKNGFTLYFGYSSEYSENGVGFTQDAMEI